MLPKPPTSKDQTEPSTNKPVQRSSWQRSLLGAPARLGLIALGVLITAGVATQYVQSSDHDDGEVDTKGRNLNLTDLYVFREKDQNSSASANDLVFVMNTNPRSLPRQQYYFSTRARYEFKVTRAADKDATPTGKTDVLLRFEFGEPDKNKQQQIKLTTIRDDNAQTVIVGKTTPIAPNPAAPPVVNQVSVGGTNLAVFAGLREDPFFFDVEQYFRVRAGAAGEGPKAGFRSPATAIDFTKDYNVNAIAVRVPIRFLQGSSQAKVFDVWETISVPGQGNKYTQFEQLARPVINEGLLRTNALLNAYNRVGPDFVAAALAGQQPAASIAAPIVAEAKQTLRALGNSEERANALLGAFLPDVMRIDTTGASGYAKALNAKGSPIRGRLLKDDVIDITLTVLSNGAITTDNVSYEGTPGNPSQGHDPLVSSFPYLALQN
ncbi:MAG: DUF4331 domain-containing protein [Stenomitos frigidus ULC029]